MTKHLPFGTRLTIAVLLATCIAGSLPANNQTESDQLAEDIRILQDGQQEIQKELAEIKKLLEQGARPAPAQPPAPVPFAPTELLVDDSPVRGQTKAAVTMFSYSDYQCPFCKQFATTTLLQLLKDYVDSGKMRIVMREYPIESIHPHALAASKAALCAGRQGEYWDMHDLIFASQNDLSDDNLRAHGEAVGLELTKYRQCMDDAEIEAEIRSHIAEAQSMGISGTPSFVLGRADPNNPGQVRVTKYVRGAQPFSVFKDTIEELLVAPSSPGE